MMTAETNDNVTTPLSEVRTSGFRWRGWTAAYVVLLALAAIPAWRASRGRTESTEHVQGVLPVGVAKVTRQDLAREVTVQAEFRPYQEVDLHSKVAGFLEKMSVDIGDRVESGQVLAVLEIPELQDDLKRAAAIEERCAQDVKRAEAAHEEARLAHERLASVDKVQPNLIAQQELDTAFGKSQETASALAAARQQVEVARAETAKLRTMARYSNLVAPFPGVITRRSADPGAFIPAGITSATQAPLVRLSQLDRLRLVFPVSMSYVSQVEVGTPVEIRVQNREHPLPGKIARVSRKIETATRTMDVEVDVANSDLSLIPGMYASVIVKLEQRDHVLTLPIQAVSGGKNPTVFMVNQKQEVEERPVKLGLGTPTMVEILSGLKEDDMVMMGTRSQVRPGQKVEPKVLAFDKD